MTPQEDATLANALEAIRTGGGPFDDQEFIAKLTGQVKEKAINGKILYSAGHPGPTSVKVDAYHRLSEMGGKGPASAVGAPGSQIVYRRRGEGKGSDLWLLGALGIVSTRSDLLERLLAYHDESAGLAALRFYKDGDWRTVCVDDQMPCHGRLKLAYSSNEQPRNGPVSLVLKALAKLYGCYEVLKAGRLGSALEDLTGGFKDKLYLRDGVRAGPNQDGPPKQPDISIAEEMASGVLWARLSALHAGGHLLGATYKPKYAHLGGAPAIDTSVLEAGEALTYPIVGMKEVSDASGGGRYVQLRNPWKQIGEGTNAKQWEGAWGSSREGAAEWSNLPGVAAELGGRPREADGRFWMTFEDFVEGFNKVRPIALPIALPCLIAPPLVSGSHLPPDRGRAMDAPSSRSRRVVARDGRRQGGHAAWAGSAVAA